MTTQQERITDRLAEFSLLVEGVSRRASNQGMDEREVAAFERAWSFLQAAIEDYLQNSNISVGEDGKINPRFFE